MNIENNIQQQLVKFGNVQGLMRFVTVETLEKAYNEMNAKKAPGIDGITKNQYGKHLKMNLYNLYLKLKNGSYTPQPVLQVEIPKSVNEKRKLGLPSFEDKLVQCVFAKILNAIYEPIFLECSYGYRPNKNAHQALSSLKYSVHNGAKYIVEADIKKFFNNVNHQVLIEFLEKIVKDKHFIRYIKKFLKCGIMIKCKEELEPTKISIPQRWSNITCFSKYLFTLCFRCLVL